jgi:quercetin dioxygenase-like cupin family protein
MTYLGETGEASAVLRTDIESLNMNPQVGTTATFVAPGSVTRGEFGLFRWDMPAGAGGAGSHFHRGFSESFYVMSGTVTFYNGSKWVEVSEGGFLYVPPGGIHGFGNPSDAPASMLILFAPGIAREKYFEELADIRRTGRTLSEQEWAELYAKHDQVNLD